MTEFFSIAVPENNFVTKDTGPITWASVLSQFPASADNLFKYAKVTDMWGSMSGVLRCMYNGRIYWWGPTDSEQYGKAIANPGSVTINPITMPPVLNLTGNGPGVGIIANLTFDLTGGAYPGMIIEVRNSFNAFLGNINLLGTGLGSGISSLLGSTKRLAVIDTGSAISLQQLT